MDFLAKRIRDLNTGDRLILEDGALATVTGTKLSAVFETSSGRAVDVFWIRDDLEEDFQRSCHPYNMVKVTEDTAAAALGNLPEIEERESEDE